MRIGIVNDMPLAREALRRVIVSSAAHQVAWLASDGAQAITFAKNDVPDVILMDLIMPGIDGSEATRRIMTDSPCPILVVTATVNGNFSKVYEAMGHGALDAVDTPSLGPKGDLQGGEPLLARIAMIGKLSGKGDHCADPIAPVTKAPPSENRAQMMIAIGASTGGPNAIAEVLSAFPKTWDASIVLIQHVDCGFAPGLADWLSAKTGLRVTVAQEGKLIEPGEVLLAATNDHLIVDALGRLRYVREPKDFCYRPSVDVFYNSLAAHWSGQGVAVVLTGMGRDGAAGMLTLRRSGWHTIAQNAATSVVWGMPRAAAESGAAVEILPLNLIGPAVVDRVKNRKRNGEVSR